MSFSRHREIYPSDEGAARKGHAPAHRADEFPAGYSLAGCSPAEPASASPAGFEYASLWSCRSIVFQRTVNCVLTSCVSHGARFKEYSMDFALWVRHRCLLEVFDQRVLPFSE
jgi:hypothetical protein